MSVITWINEIYEIFKYMNEEAIYYSSLSAMADLVKHGCTTAFDHQYCYPESAGKLLIDRQMDAAALLGIRYHAGRGANTLPKSKGSTVPDEMVETTDEFLNDCQRLIDKYHDPGDFSMRQNVVAPCQPVNCYKETFTESIQLARDKGVLLHTHLGEGENAPMNERWGKRTLQWCEDIGTLEPGKGADLFMIDTGKLKLSGTLHDPANLIARTGITGPVWLTMINGKVVYRESSFPGVDERQLAEDAEKTCTRVIRDRL